MEQRINAFEKGQSAMKALYGLGIYIDNKKAKLNFQKAYSLAKTETEKEGIQKKINGLMP